MAGVDDDLDELLERQDGTMVQLVSRTPSNLAGTLDDFKKVDMTAGLQKSPEPSASSRERADRESSAEEVEVSSQQSGPSPLPSSPASLGQGLGLPLPSQPTGRRKSGGASRNPPGGDRSSPSPTSWINDRISATLDELNQRTQETVESMEADGPDEEMVERLVKQFEELGGNQDMQSLMDVMMKQLLSKDVLEEPMREIGERYPGWLEANKSTLSQQDLTRYTKQLSYIRQLCALYGSDPDNFEAIVDLMQHMQECGQPPPEIVNELAPGLDLSQGAFPMSVLQL